MASPVPGALSTKGLRQRRSEVGPKSMRFGTWLRANRLAGSRNQERICSTDPPSSRTMKALDADDASRLIGGGPGAGNCLRSGRHVTLQGHSPHTRTRSALVYKSSSLDHNEAACLKLALPVVEDDDQTTTTGIKAVELHRFAWGQYRRRIGDDRISLVAVDVGCGLRGSLQRFGEFLRWCHPVEGLSRASVELVGGEVEILLGECCHVGTFGEVLA